MMGSIPACAGEPARGCCAACPSRVYPRVCGGTQRQRHGFLPNRGLSPRVRGNQRSQNEQTHFQGSIPACAGEPVDTDDTELIPRVYPRVCGGTGTNAVYAAIHQGLSPRVRGNRPGRLPPPDRGGSIPACAGEPPARQGPQAQARVYPRVCGGTIPLFSGPTGTRGLSPRVRGNRSVRTGYRRVWWSIPACAGEPPAPCAAAWAPRVYPRVCGGTGRSDARSITARGLSPRVRGNRPPLRRRLPGRRSIPACAGEPASTTRAGGGGGVYPRVCGGTLRPPRHQPRPAGLSPRVRGNPRPPAPPPRPPGSIPACAGEPPTRHRRPYAARVYPRVCGGTTYLLEPVREVAGLSPRVRGNQLLHRAAAKPPGSIPACAGEPAAAPCSGTASRVYPRVCGGTAALAEGRTLRQGLSPRVRGNQRRGPRPRLPGRSIPACAGEPPPR